MKINYFKFEVTPNIFAGKHGGEEKVLEIRIEVDGEVYTDRKIMDVEPFETEIDYYAKRGVESLKWALISKPKDK